MPQMSPLNWMIISILFLLLSSVIKSQFSISISNYNSISKKMQISKKIAKW